MQLSNAIRASLATAALALLAGCAGGAQIAPSGVGPQSNRVAPSARFEARAALKSSVGELVRAGEFAHRTIAKGFSIPLHLRPKKNKHPNSVVIASDNVSGNLDVYDQSGNLVGTSAGVAGWGAASFGPGEVAWGSWSYGIVVATVSSTAIAETAQLTPSQFAAGSEALGLAFDSKGGLYGDNFSGTCIDYWSPATIAGYSGTPLAPDQTVCPSGFQMVDYLAADGKTLYVDGYDLYFNMALGTVKFPSGKTKILQDPIANGLGGSPGGVAVDAHHEVFVNNEYGTITGYLKGKGASNETVDWDFTTNEYTAINLAYDQTNLWAANVIFANSSLGSQVTDNTNPLGSVGTIVSSPIGNEEYLGIAASSANK